MSASTRTSGVLIKSIGLTSSRSERFIGLHEPLPENAVLAFDMNRRVDALPAAPSMSLVSITVTTSAKSGDRDLFTATVTVNGLFEFTGTMPISRADFEQQNAAAILYPYAREFTADLFRRGQMPEIQLPPINFVGAPPARKN